MEFFNKAQAVRLRSHLDKFLVADENEHTVRQSRNGSSRRVKWTVEVVESNTNLVRLKSFYDRYLTASDESFLLGMTGKKVLQTTKLDESVEWEPVRDGFQVKLRTRAGKFLRANGGTPPWRNSVTHDVPQTSTTQDWVLWEVDATEIPEYELSSSRQATPSSSSSMNGDLIDSEIVSPMSIVSNSFLGFSPRKTEMDLFRNAKAVRLRSHHDKYLLAEEDEGSVCQDRNGTSRRAMWIVEFVEGTSVIRLKSCYGKYLAASNVPFLLGMTGKKVLQILPRRLDSSVEWEPIRDGFQVKFKTRYGNFLRANGGLPPWRNSITHDIPHRTATQDWILWDVDVVDIQVQSASHESKSAASEPCSPSMLSIKSPRFARLESRDSFVGSPIKADGRTIHYKIADDNGDVDDAINPSFFTFKGNEVDELTHKLEEETGLQNILVCSRNPLNGNLYPLRLHLPPNNTTMHVVVLPPSARVVKESGQTGKSVVE